MKYDHPNLDVRHDSDNDVKNLMLSAKRRKEQKMKYHLISELLSGKTVNITKSPDLYEAVNREKMEFEQLLKIHPEQVEETIEYVKMRRLQQDGVWWGKKSESKLGEYGAIPPCCYYARPREYWRDRALVKNFFNTFSKFRISESPI